MLIINPIYFVWVECKFGSKNEDREFPACLVVSIRRFQCRGLGSVPGWEMRYCRLHRVPLHQERKKNEDSSV